MTFAFTSEFNFMKHVGTLPRAHVIEARKGKALRTRTLVVRQIVIPRKKEKGRETERERENGPQERFWRNKFQIFFDCARKGACNRQ